MEFIAYFSPIFLVGMSSLSLRIFRLIVSMLNSGSKA